MKAVSSIVVVFAMVGILAVGCGPKASSGASAPKTASAPAAAADVTFASAMKPIIDERCGDCHTQEAKGRFSLRSREDVIKGGKSGAAVQPGNADTSLLYKMVTGQPGLKRMPPKGAPLSEAQIASIKAWINGGAK